MKIQQIPNVDVPDAMVLEAIALENATWPTKPLNTKTATEQIAAYRSRSENRQAFFAREEQLLGYAEVFPRTIFTESGSLIVWGLGSVCVAKESRGLGLGRKIAEACFRAVDKSDTDVCLFQTGVPDFYKKLNCQLVSSTFIDKTNIDAPGKNPFWDDYAMIYPATFNWPAGIIDLNGKGY